MVDRPIEEMTEYILKRNFIMYLSKVGKVKELGKDVDGRHVIRWKLLPYASYFMRSRRKGFEIEVFTPITDDLYIIINYFERTCRVSVFAWVFYKSNYPASFILSDCEIEFMSKKLFQISFSKITTPLSEKT
jgi:hypothetical protein